MATLLERSASIRPALPERGAVIGGRYEVVRLIGRGGHGSVFAARHLGTGQDVALKILQPPDESEEDLAIKRFFLEARVTSGLLHPNTVRVFDFGQDDSGLVYLVLELLVGRSLRQELKARGAFTEKEAIAIADAVARSLGEAHAAGLIHRDLKPDNVFLHRAAGEQVIKVLDFGVAKLSGAHPTLSTPTSVPGTPAYMSPEQALSGAVDARSDIYSLGVILYHLAAGALPFSGASDPQTLYMHVHEPVPDLRRAAKTPVSEGFVRLVERAMAKEPARRFQDVAALREALAAVERGEAPRRRGRRSRAWIAVGLGGVLGVAVTGLMIFGPAGHATGAAADVAQAGAEQGKMAPKPAAVDNPSLRAPAGEATTSAVPPARAARTSTPSAARMMRPSPKPKAKKARAQKDPLRQRLEDLVGTER